MYTISWYLSQVFGNNLQVEKSYYKTERNLSQFTYYSSSGQTTITIYYLQCDINCNKNNQGYINQGAGTLTAFWLPTASTVPNSSNNICTTIHQLNCTLNHSNCTVTTVQRQTVWLCSKKMSLGTFVAIISSSQCLSFIAGFCKSVTARSEVIKFFITASIAGYNSLQKSNNKTWEINKVAR